MALKGQLIQASYPSPASRKSNDDQERPCPALLKAAESACTAWMKRHPPTSGLGTQTFLEDKGLDAGKNVGPGGGVEALS